MGLTMSEAQRMLARMNEGFAAAADMIGGLLTAWEESQHALAASQAECARLREAMRAASERARLSFYMEAHVLLERALASAPGGTAALREVALQVAGAVWAAAAPSREMDANQCAAIVSRILGERSDDAPQGRGERAKGGGDA